MATRDTPSQEQHSCHSSRAASEPIWAHATRVDRWVALGYTGSWGAKALPESELAAEVKSHLTQFEDRAPNGRVQFIRQSGASFEEGIPLFLARSDGATPWLRRFTLASYDELLSMDLVSLLEAEGPAAPQPDPIFLVCVNGRRDLCCARYGQAAYDAFAKHAPTRAWQTTHLGGHRFAATGVVLPYGLHYGRIEPEHAQEIIARTDSGRLLLTQLRGRTTLPAPAQAAEHSLRAELELDEIKALDHLGTEKLDEGSWRVQFRTLDGPQPLARSVRQLPGQFHVIKTTGDSEPAPVGHFQVTN